MTTLSRQKYVFPAQDIRSVSVNFHHTIRDKLQNLCEEEPWSVVNKNVVVKMEAMGTTRFIRLNGIDSYRVDNWSDLMGGVGFPLYIGFMVLLSEVEDIHHFPPGIVSYSGCQLTRERDLNMVDLKYFTSNKISGISSLHLNEKYYPQFIGGSPVGLTKGELLLVELAITALPNFVRNVTPQDCMKFKPLEFKETVTLSDGQDVCVKMSFPESSSDVWDELHSFIEPESVPDPIVPRHIRTRRQAVRYYRELLGKAALPSLDYIKNMDGSSLKDLLKQCKINIRGCLEKSDLIEVAKRNKPGPVTHEDQYNKIFQLAGVMINMPDVDAQKYALDLELRVVSYNPVHMIPLTMITLMELCMYDKMVQFVQDHFDSYPHKSIFMWNYTLLLFIKKGADSMSARRSLAHSIKENHFIYVCFVTPNTAVNLAPGIPERAKSGDLSVASSYIREFMPQWYHTKGAIKWVQTVGKEYYNGSLDIISVDVPKKQLTKKANEELKTPFKIKPLLMNCHLCEAGKMVSIKKCSQCMSVGYCSRDCQVEDWKTHKHNCKKKN